jgi:hypothetical protein
MKNKRIEKVVDAAKIGVVMTKGMEGVQDGCYVISPDRLEYFAKLLIEECIEIADLEGDYVGYLANYFEIK